MGCFGRCCVPRCTGVWIPACAGMTGWRGVGVAFGFVGAGFSPPPEGEGLGLAAREVE